MVETLTLLATQSSVNPFIGLRQPMHVRQELDDSHHASTHTNVQGSLMDTEMMLLHCIFSFIPVKFIMGPAAFGNASFGPPTSDNKSSHFC